MNIFLPICYILRFLTLLPSVGLVLGTTSLGFYQPTPLICAAVVGLSSLAPRAMCSIALVLLPLGGNRPGTPHAFHAILFGASLLIGLTIYRISASRCRTVPSLQDVTTHPLLLAGLLYCFFSVASLIAVPINHVVDEVRNLTNFSSLDGVGTSLLAIVRTGEHTLVYSFVSVYLTLLAYALGVDIFLLCRNNPAGSHPNRTSLIFLGAVGLGLVASAVIGLLDYYHFIDLRWFRPLDPIVNPGEQQFRLQSLFAHSGWYAEYLSLAMSTCLVLLALNAPFWLRAATVVLGLALGEFILILTYQRGGWISYPVTLFAVWSAIYVVRCLEQRRIDVASALKKSLAKILLSLPLTIIISLALVTGIQGKESVESALSPYVSRFKDIQRTGDRTDFFFAGLLVGSKHPILGAGADCFAWQFEREFESPQGSFFSRYVLPLHGSAHNVYAQTFSGKGLAGLISLLAIPYLMIRGCRRIIPDNTLPIASKLVALTGGCFGCAFLVYGNVQEVFYIQILQFLFFALVATVASVDTISLFQSETSRNRLASVSAAVVVIHLVWEFIAPGATRKFYQEERVFGCFPPELSPAGETYRWCGEHSLTEHSVSTEAHSLSLLLEAGPTPQSLTLRTRYGATVTQSLTPGERRTVTIPLKAGADLVSPVPVRIDAAASFVPHELWPESTDSRRLAFKILSVKTDL